jgi:glycosyltransferase involved in cell wall biosynthesis
MKPSCLDSSSGLADRSKEEKPAVSVVIPCYNLGTYLYQAIDSVFAQTFQDFEIILVDDGSTDEFTRLAIDSLDCPKTRLVRQENQGLPGARNAGIRLAAGRYICCLDADDRLRPGYFAAAVPFLDSQPEVGFVTGYKQLFDEQEGVDEACDCSLPNLLVENPVIVPALFRREAWQEVGGFCETFSASGIEDWDFWISLLEAGYRAQVIPEVLYDYRFRADAMSVGMYVPQTWGRLNQELVERHAPTYQRYLGEVFKRMAARWAAMRQWALDQDRAIGWWERQSGIWQRLAQDREAWIRHLQEQIHAMEEEIAAAKDQLQALNTSQQGADQQQSDASNSEDGP